MGFGMGCYCAQGQTQHVWQNLTSNQKQTVRLAMLMLTLKDDGFPKAITGWKGMLKAHAILQERNSYGILIGGLSENIWNPKATEKDLSGHKDVDVLVLSPSFRLKEKYEGGIDWWLPREWKKAENEPMLEYRDINATVALAHIKWWQNGGGWVLDFQVTDLPIDKPAPGLYLPSPEFVASMRANEKLANSMNQISEEEVEALEHKIRQTLKNRLPKFVSDIFKLFTLDDRFSDHFSFFPSAFFRIKAYRDTLVSAIKKLAENLPEPETE